MRLSVRLKRWRIRLFNWSVEFATRMLWWLPDPWFEKVLRFLVRALVS